MKLCRTAFVVALLLMGLGMAGIISPPAGAAASSDPVAIVRTTIDKILALLQDPALAGDEHLAEKERRIIDAVVERFDFPAMAQRALGAGWRRLDEPRRQQFVDLFTRLLENTYVKKIERYSGQKVIYGDHRVRGKKAVVETFLVKDDVKTPVIYRLKRRGDDWQVYDVVIEGVSLVSNYRTQFSSIVRKEGIDGLLRRLADKVETLEHPRGQA